MTTMKRADEVQVGEWVRVGQQAFRVGKIWTDLDQLCFQVGRGGDGFYRFWPDRDVEVVALVDYAEKARLDKVNAAIAAFEANAREIVPDIDDLDDDGETDDLGELEALTWLAAARALREAL